MTGRLAYLDYNASAPVRPAVRAAVDAALAAGGNPSSVHGAGRAARRILEEAREAVAALAGARPEQAVFVSGGTEANNLALTGLAAAHGVTRVLVSAIEHPSVLEGAALAGVPVAHIPANFEGQVRLDALAAMLAEGDGPALVSLMLANNETGVIQPVREAVRLVREHGGLLHCDAVQAAGKIPVDMAALGVDALSLSSHKIGGPQGVGVLVLRENLPLAVRSAGGGQELRRRAGTENVPGAAGFGAAAEAAMAELASGLMGQLAAWRDTMEARLMAGVPGFAVFGKQSPRLPNTSCFGAPGAKAETLVMALDLAGVAVSAGAACSSGKVTRSHVLSAMGVADRLADSAIRASAGWDTREEDWDRLVEAWLEAYGRARSRRGGPQESETGAADQAAALAS